MSLTHAAITYRSDARCKTIPMNISTTNMQGILFKRRDHFKNNWRPRFFIVDHGVLRYFILKNEYECYTNSRGESEISFTQLVGNLLGPFEEFNASQSLDATTSQFNPNDGVTKTGSIVNEIFDQQPRGTFKLTKNATILVEDEISLPQMKLFPFSINIQNTDEIHEDSSSSNMKPAYKVYLAATTIQDRDKWILNLSEQCHGNGAPSQSTIEYTESKDYMSNSNNLSASGTAKILVKRANTYYDTRFFHVSPLFYGIDERHLFHDSILYLTPSLIWIIMRQYDIHGKEMAFILLWVWTQRFIWMRALGTPLPTPTNHVGPVSFNFTVDLTGVLRYIKLNQDIAAVSITSIVIKAVADALQTVPGLS